MVPTSIWSAVTPRPVALLVSPAGALPHTGSFMEPKTSLEVPDGLVVLLPSTVAVSFFERLQATLDQRQHHQHRDRHRPRPAGHARAATPSAVATPCRPLELRHQTPLRPRPGVQNRNRF